MSLASQVYYNTVDFTHIHELQLETRAWIAAHRRYRPERIAHEIEQDRMFHTQFNND